MTEKPKRKNEGQLRRRRFARLIIVVIIVVAVLTLLLPRSVQPGGTLLLNLSVDGETSLYRLDIASGALERIQTTRGNRYQAVLSPDGERIAYSGPGPDGIRGGIYITDVNFAEAQLVTSGPYDSSPRWSPDGTQIVFTRSRSPFSAVARVNLLTGEEGELTDYQNDLEADWSPDGERIIFTTSRYGFQELATMAPDGSDIQRLTHNENLNDLRAVYSPDGTQIAYMTNYSVGDGTGEIWLMNADGSNPRRLTHDDVDDRGPVWSPDGRHVAFISGRSAGGGLRASFHISIYSLERDEVIQVTQQGQVDTEPQWSPDGKWLAFLSRQESNLVGLYIVRSDGTDVRRIPLQDAASLSWFIWLR